MKLQAKGTEIKHLRSIEGAVTLTGCDEIGRSRYFE